jgi:hypothetical protein
VSSTPTITPTPGKPLRVWPIPFHPSEAVKGTLKAEYLPPGGTLNIFTVSGERVARVETASGGRVEWKGVTDKGKWVAPGIYYYVVDHDAKTLLKGVLVVKGEPR